MRKIERKRNRVRERERKKSPSKRGQKNNSNPKIYLPEKYAYKYNEVFRLN